MAEPFSATLKPWTPLALARTELRGKEANLRVSPWSQGEVGADLIDLPQTVSFQKQAAGTQHQQ